MLKSCSPINIMRVFISSKMLRLQFIGMKSSKPRQRLRYVSGRIHLLLEPIDYNKAGQWFSLAAEKGDKDAEEVLRNNLRYNRFTKKWDAVR